MRVGPVADREVEPEQLAGGERDGQRRRTRRAAARRTTSRPGGRAAAAPLGVPLWFSARRPRYRPGRRPAARPACVPNHVGRRSGGRAVMLVAVRITSALVDPALLDLPWSTPLEQWPADHLVALPQGISRHVVRFVRLGRHRLRGQGDRRAGRRAGVRPAARPGADRLPGGARRWRSSPTGRPTTGEPLDPVLITRHLQFSLPYRALFSHTLRPETMSRLLDALAALMVRMHLTGFFWGDCSLSNTLFRRDAGRVRRLPGGRRDRRAAPRALQRSARRGPGDRPGEHLRRGAGPRRPPACCTSRSTPRWSARRWCSATSGSGTRSPTSSRSSGRPGTTSRAGSAASTSWASTSPRWPCRRWTTGATWSGRRWSTPATTPAGCSG